MKLLQLRYLIAIADNDLNMTIAANKLHRSQPGLSKQLQKLEVELGMQLFARHGKSLAAVTPAGRQVIAHARLIMRELENIIVLARDVDKRRAAADKAVSNKQPRSAQGFDGTEAGHEPKSPVAAWRGKEHQHG